jgi:hypothetical protein
MNKYTKSNLKGNGNDVLFYKKVPSYYQKGYGFGSFLKNTYYNFIQPMFKKHILPKLERGVNRLGKETISSLSNIANDVVDGKDFNESFKSNLTNSVENLKRSVENELKGEGKKKQRKNIILIKKKNFRKFDDPFSY